MPKTSWDLWQKCSRKCFNVQHELPGEKKREAGPSARWFGIRQLNRGGIPCGWVSNLVITVRKREASPHRRIIERYSRILARCNAHSTLSTSATARALF